jgi:hypothetical protein
MPQMPIRATMGDPISGEMRPEREQPFARISTAFADRDLAVVAEGMRPISS